MHGKKKIRRKHIKNIIVSIFRMVKLWVMSFKFPLSKYSVMINYIFLYNEGIIIQ